MNRSLFLFAVLLLFVPACATQAPLSGESEVRYGRIARIDPVTLDGDQHLGLGAIIGVIAGGVLGHRIGSGSGRDVTTVAGALGGAYAGSRVQNKYVDRQPGQHITVTLNNGVVVVSRGMLIRRCAWATACA